MTIQWTTIETDAVPPPGPFNPLWSLVIEAVVDWKTLRLHADGSWTIAGGVRSGPDGVGVAVDASLLLLPDCSPGCLVGRFGGSSVGPSPAAAPSRTTGDGSGMPATRTGAPAVQPGIFPIGRDCIYKVPDGVVGPLFVGFNMVSRPLTIAELKLTVQGANLPL